MKFPKLSALFGAAMSWILGGSSANSLTPEQQASLEASEKKLGEMEDENARLKTDNDAHTKKIGELEASVTALQGQVTQLTADNKKLGEEKAELQKKLDEKPNGQATTVIPDEGKEAAQPGESSEKKNNYETSVDAEVRELKKQHAALTIK